MAACIAEATVVRVSEIPSEDDKQEDEGDEENGKVSTPKTETRRFCYRLTGVEWQPVKWKEYNNKYGKLYHTSETISANVFGILAIWGDSPLEKIPMNDDMADDLAKWVKRHNDIIDRFERRKYTQNSFVNAYSESLEDLSKTCHDRSRRIRMFSTQRELTEFLREEFERNAYALEYAGYFIQAIADDIEDS